MERGNGNEANETYINTLREKGRKTKHIFARRRMEMEWIKIRNGRLGSILQLQNKPETCSVRIDRCQNTSKQQNTQVISSCIIEARLFTEEITENKYLLEGVPSSFFFLLKLAYRYTQHKHIHTLRKYRHTDEENKKKQKQDNNITSIILNTQQRNKERKSEIERQICKRKNKNTRHNQKHPHTKHKTHI